MSDAVPVDGLIAGDDAADSSEWLKPREVIRLYAAENGGPGALRGEIERSLRDGDLRACARYVWISDEKRLGFAFKREPTPGVIGSIKSIHDFTKLSINDWRKSASWSDDVANWHWKRGWFFVTLRAKPRKRYIFRDVRLLREDVRACFDPSYKGTSKRHSGRPRDEEKWRAYWHKVCAMIVDGSINHKDVASNEKLASKIHESVDHSPGYQQCFDETAKLRAFLKLSRPRPSVSETGPRWPTSLGQH